MGLFYGEGRRSKDTDEKSNKMIISTFLSSVCFVSTIQLVSGNYKSDHCWNIQSSYRPDWKDGVIKGFKKAHFNNPTFPKPVISSLDVFNQLLNARGQKGIYEGASNTQKTESRRLLRDFIERLFKPDLEAYERTDSSYHAFPRPSQGHFDYLTAYGANLITKNTDIKQSALKHVDNIGYSLDDCAEIKSLLNDAFNAPANLRYGMNDDLGELLDPMGNIYGQLTTKESNWILSANYDWHKTTINNFWYLESSTGMLLRERGGYYVPSYWIFCSADNPACRQING